MRTRLELVVAAFVAGYHSVLEHGAPEEVAPELQLLEPELRGFAFEGAAMGLALLDRLTPWRHSRISEFLAGAGHAHAYMVHVGVGWVWARFPFDFRRTLRRLDPLLSWLAFDGWGFHEGFFHWPEYLAGRLAPPRLTGYERQVFDQGLGRSLWFVNGGNPDLIARTIAGLPPVRQSDLWSGVGLAATYAGIVDSGALEALRNHAGAHGSALAQGSAFAAKARQRAGYLTSYAELATTVLCGLSAAEAARLCDTTLENLPTKASQPAYEIWRQRIQQHFQASLT
jgi:hypothetical protein